MSTYPPSYPRETVEFQAVTVTRDGDPVTDGVVFFTTVSGQRPPDAGSADWEVPVSLDGKIGVMVEGRPVGTYHVWANDPDNPESPVIDCGAYRVT